MKRIAILIDGGHLRVLAKKANFRYTPDFIEKFALQIQVDNEEILRVLYYDCAPFTGMAQWPISRLMHQFEGSDDWLNILASRDLFAVRRGVLKFRGWKPKASPASDPPTDDDYAPQFMHKVWTYGSVLTSQSFRKTEPSNGLRL